MGAVKVDTVKGAVVGGYALPGLHAVVADGHGVARVGAGAREQAAPDEVDVALQDLADAERVLRLAAVLLVAESKHNTLTAIF